MLYVSWLLLTLSSKTQRPVRDVSSYSAVLFLVSTLLQGARFFDAEDGSFKDAYGVAQKAYQGIDNPANGFLGGSAGEKKAAEGSNLMRYLMTFSQAMASNQNLFALVVVLANSACCMYILHTVFVRQFDKKITDKADKAAGKVDKGKKSKRGKSSPKESENGDVDARPADDNLEIITYPKLELLVKGVGFLLAICSNFICSTPFEQAELMGMVLSMYSFYPQLQLIQKSNDMGKNRLSKMVVTSCGLQFVGLLSLLNAMCVEKVAYGPFAVVGFFKSMFLYKSTPLEIVIVVVTVLRLVLVGVVTIRYLVREKEFPLLSLLTAGSLFFGPFGVGWCSPAFFDFHPGKFLALSFLAFSTLVVCGTFFTGAPGLLSLAFTVQMLMKLHDLELYSADDIVQTPFSATGGSEEL